MSENSYWHQLLLWVFGRWGPRGGGFHGRVADTGNRKLSATRGGLASAQYYTTGSHLTATQAHAQIWGRWQDARGFSWFSSSSVWRRGSGVHLNWDQSQTPAWEGRANPSVTLEQGCGGEARKPQPRQPQRPQQQQQLHQHQNQVCAIERLNWPCHPYARNPMLHPVSFCHCRVHTEDTHTCTRKTLVNLFFSDSTLVLWMRGALQWPT